MRGKGHKRQPNDRGISLVIPAKPTPEVSNPRAGTQESAMNKQPAIYILASKRNGTLCIGVTSNLIKRIRKHRNNLLEGFTERYGVHNPVWYEPHVSMESAIQREKQLKDWKRRWKMRLIETANPNWEDLYHTLV